MEIPPELTFDYIPLGQGADARAWWGSAGTGPCELEEDAPVDDGGNAGEEMWVLGVGCGGGGGNMVPAGASKNS